MHRIVNRIAFHHLRRHKPEAQLIYRTSQNMRVLLLGATGNVGSRLLPALRASDHEIIAYVRNPAKLSSQARKCTTEVVTGSATDSRMIKEAILTHHCDAVINSAGLAPMFGSSGELPAIFAAVLQAIRDAQSQRGGPAIRCWFLSGFSILDGPQEGWMMMD
jgi:hypothetical protein